MKQDTMLDSESVALIIYATPTNTGKNKLKATLKLEERYFVIQDSMDSEAITYDRMDG